MTRNSRLGLLLVVGCSARHDRAAVAPGDTIVVPPGLTVVCVTASPDSFVHEPAAATTASSCPAADAGRDSDAPQLDLDPNAEAETRARAVADFLTAP